MLINNITDRALALWCLLGSDTIGVVPVTLESLVLRIEQALRQVRAKEAERKGKEDAQAKKHNKEHISTEGLVCDRCGISVREQVMREKEGTDVGCGGIHKLHEEVDTYRAKKATAYDTQDKQQEYEVLTRWFVIELIRKNPPEEKGLDRIIGYAVACDCPGYYCKVSDVPISNVFPVAYYLSFGGNNFKEGIMYFEDRQAKLMADQHAINLNSVHVSLAQAMKHTDKAEWRKS